MIEDSGIKFATLHHFVVAKSDAITRALIKYYEVHGM